MKRDLVKYLIVCAVVLVLPSIVFSTIFVLDTIFEYDAIFPKPCDYIFSAELQMPRYVLALGIASVIICIVLIICYVLVLCKSAKSVRTIGIMVVSLLSGIFGVEWIYVGIKLLYPTNNNCIRNGIIHIITGSLLECISAINIFKQCHCNCKKKDNTQN
jgi:hypothetical protein